MTRKPDHPSNRRLRTAEANTAFDALLQVRSKVKVVDGYPQPPFSLDRPGPDQVVRVADRTGWLEERYPHVHNGLCLCEPPPEWDGQF